MSCPYVHICKKPICLENKICELIVVFNEAASRKRKLDEGKEKRKEGKKMQIDQEARRKEKVNDIERKLHDAYGHLEPCIKSGFICDKHTACSILGECLVKMERFKDKNDLIESLKGPIHIKQIIQLLRKYDPGPMRTYYDAKFDKRL